jgi:hypothetical protein
MLVMGIDPGQTTGWAVYDTARDAPVGSGTADRLEGFLHSPLQLGRYLEDIIQKYRPDKAVIESVVLHGRMNRDKAFQIIAFTVALMTAHACEVDVQLLSPGERGRGSPAPASVKGPHARDAYQLATAWYVLCNQSLHSEKEKEL